MWSAATEHDGAGLMAMVLGSARSALETLRHKLARNRLRVLEADFRNRLRVLEADLNEAARRRTLRVRQWSVGCSTDVM